MTAPGAYTEETPFHELTHVACGGPAGGATLAWLDAMEHENQRQMCVSCKAKGIGWADVVVADEWTRDWAREL